MVQGFYKIKPDHRCEGRPCAFILLDGWRWSPGRAAVGRGDPDTPRIIAEPCEGRYAGPEYPGGGPLKAS